MSLAISSGTGLFAARSMSALTQQIAESKQRLQTGTRLLKPSANSDLWRVSTEMKSKASALALLRTDLDSTKAVMALGSTALTSAKEKLESIRGLLATAKADDADLSAIQRQLVSEGKLLTSTARDASLAGINILTGSPETLSFRASTGEGGNPYVITLDKATTVLFGAGSQEGILETPFDLTGLVRVENDSSMLLGLSGVEASISGVDAVPINTDGLGGTNWGVTTARQYQGPTSAVVQINNVHRNAFGSGDRLQFQLSLQGAAYDVSLLMPDTEDYEVWRSKLQSTIDATVGSGRVRVTTTSDGYVSIHTVETGKNATLAVGSYAMVDGDGTVTGTGGLTAQDNYSTDQFRLNGALRTYDSLGTLNLSGIDQADRLRLQIDTIIDGVTRTSTIDVRLSGVTDTSAFKSVLNAAIAQDAALGAYAGATMVGGDVAVYLKGEGGSVRVKSLVGVDGNGSTLSNPSLRSGSATGKNAIEDQVASAKSGTFFTNPLTIPDRGSISYDFIRNGVATSISIVKADVDSALGGAAGYTMGSGYIKDVGTFSKVVQYSLQKVGITDVAVRPSGTRLYFFMTGDIVDGDRIGFGNVVGVVPATRAKLTTGSEFTAPITLDATQTLAFALSLNGQSGMQVRIDRGTIDAVLGGNPGHSPGVIANATELARVVQRAVNVAGLPPIDVEAAGNRLQFTKRSAGAASLAISDFALLEKSAFEDGTNLLSLDLTSDAFVGVSRRNFMDHIDVAVSNVDALIKRVTSAKDHTDTVGRLISNQSDFSSKLEGIFRTAFGKMVDIDMNAEEARLKALEARQALLKKSISIINESQKNILMLFQDLPGTTEKRRFDAKRAG